jgi:hypothetical protein
LGPIALAVLLVAWLYVKESSARRVNERNPSYSRKQRNDDRKVVCTIIGFIFFSPTSIIIFQTFVCDRFEDGTEVLVADATIECWTGLHTTYMIYAALFVCVYPIGLPCFYIYHLRHNARLINPPDALVVRENEKKVVSERIVQKAKMKLRESYSKIQGIKFVYGSYLPKYMYFEIVECFRRLVLTAVPILFLRSTIMQLIIIELVSMLFCVLYMEMKPFALDSDNKIAAICQWTITLTILGSLCLRVDMTEETSFGPKAIVSALSGPHLTPPHLTSIVLDLLI